MYRCRTLQARPTQPTVTPLHCPTTSRSQQCDGWYDEVNKSAYLQPRIRETASGLSDAITSRLTTATPLSKLDNGGSRKGSKGNAVREQSLLTTPRLPPQL